MQDSGSLAVLKVTARDQGHYKGPSGAFVTYCNISLCKYFLILFCLVFKYIDFLNLILSRKPQDFAENSRFFVCLFPFCWNSDSKNYFVTYLYVGDI